MTMTPYARLMAWNLERHASVAGKVQAALDGLRWLSGDGWRYVSLKDCRDCGEPIFLMRSWDASLPQWKRRPKRDGAIHPFDTTDWPQSHMRTCRARRPYTPGRSRLGSAQHGLTGQEGHTAGSGRDESVARKLVSQAEGQTTWRAGLRATPPPSVPNLREWC